jgi:hypothetical protein
VHLSNDDVREILRLLDESPYDELKIETEGFSLTLKRSRSRPRPLSRTRRRPGMTGTRHG